MSFPSQFDANGFSEFDRLEAEVRGRDMEFNVQTEQGDYEIKVTSGQDVAYLKMQLSKLVEVDYDLINLYVDEKLMIDPLSFEDFHEFKNINKATIIAKFDRS
jgi:hypothetical protein